MRRWHTLALMEQLIMVLVFALAAALCLKAFVLADRISRTDAVRDQALLRAQSAAETIKSCRGDGARAAELTGGVWTASAESGGGSWRVAYGDDWTVTSGEASYVVETTVRERGSYLGEAVVLVRDAEGTTAAELTVRWQTGGGGHAE